MAGAGKSTTGRLLALRLGFAFTDLDGYIQEREGDTIQGILDRKGAQGLREIEEKRLRELDLRRRVIAPGGSIIYSPALMEYLMHYSIPVFLDEPFEVLEKRLQNAPTRGIVGYPEKSLRQLYDERHPLYAKYAAIIIDPGGKTPGKIAAEIIARSRLL